MNGVLRQSLRLGSWAWVRACLQGASLLLLALVLDPRDFGRYVTAYAIASCVAPLLVSGPAFVYLEAHRAFGAPPDQFARVWARALVVLGPPCALLVPLGMVGLAGEVSDAGLWFAVGLTEIVFAGFAEMTGRYYQLEGDRNRRRFWRALPHAVRLLAVLGALVAGAHVTLPAWVALTFVLSMLVAIGARRVPRKDAPRAVEALLRLVRTGFRYGGNVVGNHVIAEGDKPFAARLVGYTTTGSLFIAQRVADLFCLPLHAVVADTLSRLLHAAPPERAGIWRSATWTPAAYAVLAGFGLAAVGHAMQRWLPAYAVADAALAWLFWLPALVFARGMLGNAAVVAGQHEAYARSHLIGAIVRIAGAICLIGFFGWPGAIASLFLAELVPLAYLWVATRRRRMATTA